MLKLFSGPRGDVHLARFVRGDDAGRFVMLREVSEASASRLSPSVDLARSIAHPKLLKLLGLVRTGGRSYLACEYVPGAALTELRAAVRKLRSPVRPAVAARIVRDALDASATARALLRNAAGLEAFSAFHPDSIWIAEFGEAMVVPIDANEVLATPRASQPPPGSNSAIDLLLELATAQPSQQVLAEGVDTHLPAALADAVFAASAAEGQVRSEADADAALLAALSPLQAPGIADEKQVAQELERFLGTALEQRRRRQGVNEEEDEAGANEATVMGHFVTQRRSANAAPMEDEPTHMLKGVFIDRVLDRENDPDGVTQINERSQPSVIVNDGDNLQGKLPTPAIISSPSWPQQFLEQTQLSKRKLLSSIPPPPRSKWPAVLLALAALAVLALVVAYLRLRH